MTIHKFNGDTKEDAIKAAKAQLGEHIVIMSTREKKPEGVLGIFKKGIYEVTVAIEEDDIMPPSKFNMSAPSSPTHMITPPTSTFSAVADEAIDITNPFLNVESKPENKAVTPVESPFKPGLSGIDLVETFREVSQAIGVDNKEKPARTESKDSNINSNIIKKEEFIAKSKNREEKIEPPQKPVSKKTTAKRLDENLPLINLVYNTLINNEVDERYINEVLDDMGNVFSQATSLDYLLSNIYQKMVLKLGKVSPIELSLKGPTVVFFIGPTGVGKTTTISKIAADFCLNKKKRVAFITADSFRIAAAEQLRTYADILSAPITEVMKLDELNPAIANYADYDLVLVDTLGFSHNNETQKNYIKDLINTTDSSYHKLVYLVLSVTTKYQDLKDIADAYRQISDYRLIFTKLDESKRHGNILNLKLYSKAELSYVTNGQTVPDDLALLNSQTLVKSLLKGK